jgi:translation initiation factor 3 subunit H
MTKDEGVLEVTDMFPFAPSITDEEEQETYLMDMLRCLRDVNVDHTAVGWYQSVSLDAALQPSFLENQAAYQAEIPDSCFLVYDHLRSAQGPPALKAFRLSDNFMRAWRDAHKSPSGRVALGLLGDLIRDGLVVELEVKLTISAIDKLLIGSMVDSKEIPEANPIGSENAAKLTLARLAQNILLSLDESIAESSRVQHYIRSIGKQQQALTAQIQKRRAENAQRAQAGEAPLPEDEFQLNLKGISEPPRLGLVMSTAQLGSLLGVCEDVFESLAVKQAL